MIFNLSGIRKTAPYLIVAALLWYALLQSGVHATLAGVICAFMIPLNVEGERRSLLRQLEHDLNPFVAFFILPTFALANAGVSLEGLSMDILWAPVTIGVIAGLVIGKPLGITGFTWFFTRVIPIGKLPEGITMVHIFAVSCLAGIGFTMSIFIGTLGFIDHQLLLSEAKLGILVASVIAAVMGLVVLSLTCRKKIPQSKLDEDVLKG